jgi:DNA-binding PadR family transcriptional regulator
MNAMSGYDLWQFISQSVAHFWPLSKSQVYAELDRLQQRGLVVGTEVPQEKLPDKRTFELTPQGAEALQAWLAEPGFEPSRARVGFLVKLFFGHGMPPDALREMLQRVREEAEQQHAQLAGIVEILSASKASVFMRATALLGLRDAEATIAWLDEVTPELTR